MVYKNLSRVEGLQQNQDFHALGTLIEGLENLSMMELKPSWAQQLGWHLSCASVVHIAVTGSVSDKVQAADGEHTVDSTARK